MKLKIITAPNPILRQVSKPIDKIDEKTRKIVMEMIGAIPSNHEGETIGAGLSAIQIGLPQRLFLAKINDKKDFQPFINPEIVATSNRIIKSPRWLEGCLSFPGLYGLVKRPREVTLKFQDLDGSWHAQRFSKFLATIIQHELDHLNGILFTDHLHQQEAQAYRLVKTKTGERMVKISLDQLPK